MLKHCSIIPSVFLGVWFYSASLFGQSPMVHVITISGAINPPASEYIHDQIARAIDARAEALIIRLNTPGGLLSSTRSIVTDLLEAPLPVVIYVAPGGSQSASAGVFITLAANIAAMAPGTNIGAAHPVMMGEQPDSIMREKITNDAAAFIRSISEKRKRNITWAEQAVRNSVSVTEKEALASQVIDIIAVDLQDLLRQIDGRKVDISTGTKTLHTAGAVVVEVEKSFRERLLDVVSDPNIAYILMMLGIYGLLFEIYNPGAIFPGIVGVLSLVLAFYSMHTLPVNYAGLALIVFAVILFLLEIKVVSHGLLTIGGIVSLSMGSIMLFRSDSMLEVITVSWQVILLTVIVTSAFFLFAIGMGIRAQRRKPTTGSQGMVGETGEALTDLEPDGQIRIHGEIWRAHSLEGTVTRGTRVVVEEVANLTLKVRRISIT